MHAGDGYKYLIRSVAAGDGHRSLSTPLTRYYAEVGTPPGRWIGSGLNLVGEGRIEAGAQVTEAQLALLIGLGRDPVTAQPLGRAYPEYKPTQERIAQRVRHLDPGLSNDERASEVARIQAEEVTQSGRQAVAGYDYTFSVPKSVSVLWGVADASTQERIVVAHHAAIADVVDYIEREVAATRTGVANRDGAVAQVGIRGIIATTYDHWDSRAGDPQLHTHVVISNKVQADLDGRWRSLDSRPMHGAVTAVSAYYNAVLADRLTRTFGLSWERRDRGQDRNAQWEIVGVSEEMIKEFSSRAREIEVEKDRMIATYRQQHGRRPSNATIVVIRAKATLATRPEKRLRSLADLVAEWRRRAGELLGRDAEAWAHSVTSGGAPELIAADRVPVEVVDEIGRIVVAEVARKRATWRHWNLWAEASRQTMHLRFPSAVEREAVVVRVVDSAERQSVALTPSEVAVNPAPFQREDGSSVFRPRHATVYSSIGVMTAEDRLLNRASDISGPVASRRSVAIATRRGYDGRLARGQVDAIASVATSGRQVDLLVGPAGAGKTTTLHAMLAAWTREHGRQSVIGLAPSAAAAEVLAGDLGVPCDNTAKWLHDFDTGHRAFQRGELIIIDEATLADTITLDRITGIASAVGAKVLLVGDWAQLQSVDAGGAFAMLAAARADVAELTEIHRFAHDWERAASLDLRAGRIEAIAAYARHDRLRDGSTEEMLEAAYAGWRSDQAAGRATILVADSTEAMHALNARARAERVLAGRTAATREVPLACGEPASAGDLVITRRNERRIRTLRGVWVRNGDRWRIDKVGKDGSLAVSRLNGQPAAIVLPAAYVAEHVDLGYAITSFRAQGVTVDTAHVLVSASSTKESLYVAMTRGRDANYAYVALDQRDEAHAGPQADEDVNARTVLYGVLHHTSAEMSAHATVSAEWSTWTSIAQLAAEYDTIAAAAQRPRWEALLRSSGVTAAQAESVIAGDSFGPLSATLRRAEACGMDIDRLFPRLVAMRDLADAEDIGAVLQSRLRLSMCPAGAKKVTAIVRPTFIAGMIPEARGAMTPDMREALDQRRDLIVSRAWKLAEAAALEGPTWVRRLGGAPTTSADRHPWLACVATVAAYRDRYGITTDLPLGPGARTEAENADRHHALAAQRRATMIRSTGMPLPSAPAASQALAR